MQAAVTGALSTAERSYPASEVRGRVRRTPCLRAAAERSYLTSKVRGSGRECQAVTAQERPRGATPSPRAGATAKKSHPTSEARGGGQEEQTHVQGVVAALSQEGLKKLSHVEGHEGRQ